MLYIYITFLKFNKTQVFYLSFFSDGEQFPVEG